MDYTVEKKELISLAGITKRFRKTDVEIGKEEFWTEIANNDALNKIHEVKRRGPNFGGLIVGVNKGSEDDPEKVNYFVGTEYDVRNSIYALENMTIPASEWLVFRCSGSIPEGMDKAKDEIFNDVLPRLNYKTNEDLHLEVYSDENKNNEEYRFDIWVPIEK